MRKGVNFVPDAIPVWPVEWYISVTVNTDVSFRVYRYFLYLYIYIYIIIIKKK